MHSARVIMEDILLYIIIVLEDKIIFIESLASGFPTRGRFLVSK